MKIILINKENEIIDANGLKIMASKEWIIGKDTSGNIVQIERYGSEEEAKDRLIAIGNAIEYGLYEIKMENVVIRL